MMTEIELNKEYTYQQICKILGWDLKAGNSKKAQIKEIESAYEFYHPENKKTHKQKKSYIFTQKNNSMLYYKATQRIKDENGGLICTHLITGREINRIR